MISFKQRLEEASVKTVLDDRDVYNLWKHGSDEEDIKKFIAKYYPKVNPEAVIKALKKNKGIKEGKMKHELEDKVESLCNCGAGMILDSSEHETTCPAYKYLKKLGY